MCASLVSLFSGCGGFDIGAKDAGATVLWANDKNKDAGKTYKKYLPEVDFQLGDITKIDKSQMPNADILAGCYPCQGFSQAAWRKVKKNQERNLFENPNNYLFLEFVDSIQYVCPKFVFIENVKGLKSSVNGWFFQAQKEMLELAGYTVFSSELNACDFGAPQSRKRIFIVGIRNDIPLEYKFPTPTHGMLANKPYYSQQEAISHLPEWPKGEFEEVSFHGHYLTRNRKKDWKTYSYTVVAHSHHVTLHPMGDAMEKVGKDHWRLVGNQNRRFSWQECGILQTFDENFEPAGNLKSKYRQIGNAVPPIFGKLLVRPVIDYLSNLNL
ncbi:MAG: DNA (cytosine-5-)-methyltransferase [Chloroflexota bacterium]